MAEKRPAVVWFAMDLDAVKPPFSLASKIERRIAFE
jgi:hypothetical protein